MKVDVPRMLAALGIHSEDTDDEMWACCPYPEHDESTPSWSIKNDLGLARHGTHYCFGCGRGGGPTELVLQVVGLSGHAAAYAWLKERKLDLDGVAPMGIEVQLRRPGVHRELEQPHGMIESYDRWTTNARRYIEARGVTEAQVERWEIACVPMGPLAGRVYFPIYDRNHRLLSWTARDYTGTARNRYREPAGKGSEGAHPGAVFGEVNWPRDDRKRTELILCEGSFNALACERVGAPHVGALYGSDLHRSQLLKLRSFDRIVIASDLDTAGNKMARKVWAGLGRWSNVWRAKFPPKKDPNDLERVDPDLLREVLWGSKAA